MTSLGKLFVELLLKDDQFGPSLAGAQKQLEATSVQLRTFGDAVSAHVTRAMAAASAALAGTVVASAAVGAEFEKQITKVAVLAGNQPGGLAQLSDAAREFGASTVFSASEAAGAMESLAQAGFDVSQIISGTDAALGLAAASGGDLATATATVAATMSQFQLQTYEVSRVADVFTQALNTSQLNLEGLQVAMSYAGTTGASLGQSLEETTAAVAMFSNLGLEASKAGTAFRSSMAQMITVSEDGEKILAKLGITTQDISPELHSFGEILRTLGEAGLTTTDAINVFGAEVGGNIAALSQQAVAMGTAYESTFEGIVASLEGSAGTAGTTAEAMLNNVAGAWEQAGGALEEFLLTLYDQFAGPLKELIDAVGTVINATTANLRRNAESVGGFFTDTLGRLTAWLLENQNYIASLVVVWSQRFTEIANILASLVPYLDEIAVLMVAIFAVTQIVAFVNMLGSAYSAVVTLQAALAALGVELSVMTAGLYAAVVAVGAIVAALVSYVAMNAEAQASADRLTAAQSRQKALNDEAYQARLAQMQTLLTAQQTAAAAELSSGQQLSDARRQELRDVLALDAATALLRQESGDLVVVQGELRSATSLVAQAFDTADASGVAEGVKGIRDEYQRTAQEAADLQAQIEKMRGSMDEFGTSSETAGMAISVYGHNVQTFEEAQVKLEGLQARMEELTATEQKFRNEVALSQDTMLQAAQREADALANTARTATDFSRTARREATAAEKQSISARETAAKRTADAYQDQLRDLQVTLGAAGDALQMARDREIAEVTAIFSEEMGLYQEGSTERIAIQERLDATLGAMRQRYAAEDAQAQAEIQAQAADALVASVRSAEERAEAVRRAMLPQTEQLALDRADAVAALEQDLVDRLAQIEGLGAEDRAAMLAQFQQQSADERLAIERDYNRQIEVARIAELQSAKAQPSGLVRWWQAQLGTLEKAIPDSFQVAFARTTREIGKFASAAGKAFDGIAGAVGSAFGSLSGLVESVTGFQFGISDVVSAVASAQAEGGPGFDMAQAATDFVTGLLAEADRIAGVLVGAVPPALQALADGLPGLLQTVAESIPLLIDGIMAALPRLIQAILDALPAILSALIQGVVQVVQAVAAMLPSIVRDLIALLPGLISELGAAIPVVIDAIVAAIPRVLNAILQGLPEILQALINALPGIILSIVNAIPVLVTALINAIPLLFTALIEAIPTLIRVVIGLVPDIIIALVQQLPNLITALVSLFPQLFVSLIANLPQIAIALVESLFTELLPAIPKIVIELVKALVASIGQVGKALGNAVWNGIKGLFGGGGNRGAFSGMDYVPATMRMTVHRGEAIIPADRAAAMRAGGMQGPAPAGYGQTVGSFGGGMGGGQPLELAVLVDGNVVDGVLVNAMGAGKAPKIQRTIRRMSGVEATVGFSRGRYNPWTR